MTQSTFYVKYNYEYFFFFTLYKQLLPRISCKVATMSSYYQLHCNTCSTLQSGYSAAGQELAKPPLAHTQSNSLFAQPDTFMFSHQGYGQISFCRNCRLKNLLLWFANSNQQNRGLRLEFLHNLCSQLCILKRHFFKFVDI